MGKKQNKRTSKTSSGSRFTARIRRNMRRIRMKIARWERNQTDEMKQQAGQSRNGWNTEGLKRHLALLEKASKKG